MTVVWLDTCHHCDRPIRDGIFCRRCLAYASDVVSSLSAVAAGAPMGSGRLAAPGSWDGASTGAAVESSAPRHAHLSGVIPVASMAATTRNKNTPTTSAWKAGRRGAYNHGG